MKNKYITISYETSTWSIKKCIEKLEEEVNMKINEGYVPCGGITVISYTSSDGTTRFRLAQALYLEKEII